MALRLLHQYYLSQVVFFSPRLRPFAFIIRHKMGLIKERRCAPLVGIIKKHGEAWRTVKVNEMNNARAL